MRRSSQMDGDSTIGPTETLPTILITTRLTDGSTVPTSSQVFTSKYLPVSTPPPTSIAPDKSNGQTSVSPWSDALRFIAIMLGGVIFVVIIMTTIVIRLKRSYRVATNGTQRFLPKGSSRA